MDSGCVGASNKNGWYLNRSSCNRRVGSNRFVATVQHGFSRIGTFGESCADDNSPAYGLLFLESILPWLEKLVKMGFVRRLLYSPIYTLKQYERGIVELFGKYRRFVEPGIHFQIPFIEITRIRDVREHTMDFPPQEVITKDNVEITVDGIIWARPGLDTKDVKMSFYNIDYWNTAVLELAKTNLRQEFGKLTLDESLVAREKIASNLQISLDKMTDNWGIKVCKVEIKLIDPPEDIKNAMHKQKIAEQERRAMRLIATGKFEAAEQEKKATIQIAEGKKEAEIQVAKGKAKAIELVNDAAEKYFIGNAQELKKLEITESCLKDNTKVILTDKGITPQLVVGELPVIKKQKNTIPQIPDIKPPNMNKPEPNI